MVKSMNNRMYRIWYSMKARCYRQSHNRYHLYGGRGIKVCDKWQAYEGFFEDMSAGYEDNLTLDRIDNDKGYTPENCRWATQKEQQNHRRNNLRVDYNGQSVTLAQYAVITGTPYSRVYKRYKKGVEKKPGMC